jgi:hypothetical protein
MEPRRKPQNGKPSDFVRLCADGTLQQVAQALFAGANVNEVDYSWDRDNEASIARGSLKRIWTFGQSGLNVAVQAHNIPLTKLLLKHKADPYFSFSAEGCWPKPSPIEDAVFEGFVDGLRLICDEFHHELRATEGPVERFIFHAIAALSKGGKNHGGGLGMLTYLIEERGLNIHFQDDNGETPISRATSHDIPFYALEYCYKMGCMPNQRIEIRRSDKKFTIAIHPEAAEEFKDMIGGTPFEAVMASAQAFTDRYHYSTTPLNRSIAWGAIEQVRVHLKYRANPYFTDSQGEDAFATLDNPLIERAKILEPSKRAAIREMLTQHVARHRIIKPQGSALTCP